MTLYNEIGGEAAITAAVERFYAKVLADPALVGYFNGVDVERLKRHQTRFLSLVLTERAYDASGTMRRAHSGRGITPDAFDLVAGHLSATLRELGVSEQATGQVIERVAALRDDIVEPAPAA